MLRGFFSFLNNLAEKIVSFFMALLLCQLPQLFQQYIDVLVGAHYEAKRNIRVIEQSAKANHKDLNEYIQKHLQNPDRDFQLTGEYMQQLVQREAFYREALEKLRKSPAYLRWWYFLLYFEKELLKQVDFKPALPLTVEAFLYALVGILLGMGIYRILLWPIYRIFSRKRKTIKLS